jgi:hypothetical protein
LTEIVEGWYGTLYAKWKKATTAVPSIKVTSETRVYDVMGRYIGNRLPDNEHGVFVVIEGEQQIKVVL